MNTPGKRWLPVTDYEGRYEVSNQGHVRSLDRWITTANQWGPYLRFCRGKILKPHLNGSGYLFVVLSKEGAHKICQVHQLVLESFAGPCPVGQEARHGSRGRLDNRWPESLCYGTHLANMEDQIRDGTRALGSARGHAKLTEKIVIVCRTRHAAGETQRALSAEFRISNQSMSKMINGQTWRHVS